MRESTIASHFVRAVLRGAQRQNLPCAAILHEAGIAPTILDEPRARIAPEQFASLVQRLWETLDDEYLGFARQRSKRGTFAMMGYTIIHCRSLEQALYRGAQFYALFPETPDIRLQREGDWARLSVGGSTLWDPDHFLLESLLLIWHRLGSWLIGQRIALEEATFAYPEPPHGSEYGQLFPCARRFSAASTSLRFHTRYLDMPLLQDEHTLRLFLRHSPADLLARPDASDSLASQIRRLLGRNCRTWPDLERMAQQLHISPQTLRRRLHEEDSSFQAIKDHLRRDLAIYHLGRKELSIQEIAEQLGFSEPSAFHRAFKKWTGLPPGTYRAQKH